eukprot:8760236-Pyramimonas_sp.AAC.2
MALRRGEGQGGRSPRAPPSPKKKLHALPPPAQPQPRPPPPPPPPGAAVSAHGARAAGAGVGRGPYTAPPRRSVADVQMFHGRTGGEWGGGRVSSLRHSRGGHNAVSIGDIVIAIGCAGSAGMISLCQWVTRR